MAVFLFYVTVICVLLAVCAGIADLLASREGRRVRDRARAEERAKRQKGADQSDASESFSWWEPSQR